MVISCKVILNIFHAVEDYCRNELMLTWETLWNLGNLAYETRLHLGKVYLSLFFVSLSSALGFYLHSLTKNWGLITVGSVTILGFVGSLVWFCLLYPGSPSKEKKKVFLLMAAALSGEAFSALLIDHFINIELGTIVSSLIATAVVFCCFALAPLVAQARDHIYCFGMMFSAVMIPVVQHFASVNFGSIVAFKGFKLALGLGYLLWLFGYVVVYSQEIAAEAHREDRYYSERALNFITGIPTVHIHITILMLRRAFPGERHDDADEMLN